MSKNPLSFDFSEVAKAKQLPASEKAVEEQAISSLPKPIQPLGINVAVEIYDDAGGGPRLLLKDLAHLTGEEFLTWVAKVYPVINIKETNANDFETRTAKARAFEQILLFHSTSIFPVKKEISPKPN